MINPQWSTYFESVIIKPEHFRYVNSMKLTIKKGFLKTLHNWNNWSSSATW